MADRPTIPPPPRVPAVAVSRLDQILDKLEDLRVDVARVEERLANEREDLAKVEREVEGIGRDVLSLKSKVALIASLVGGAITAVTQLLPEVIKLLHH